ncbi:MAG: hypothetical protein IJU50_09545, partial [Lachnospiraceae bacterium]|nr:hypothetical protein [Lachnospiraceae bacterium]
MSEISSSYSVSNSGREITKGTRTQQAAPGSAVRAVRTMPVQATASSYQAGQSLQGQVVNVDGKNVILKLANGQETSARLENGMNLTPGQELSFLIRGRSGGSLLLSPLMENTSSDPTVLKALAQAGLPANPQTVGMVFAMMDAGENIGRGSLLQMHHQMNLFPEASPVDLVQLKSLGIPITQENLDQLGAYKSMNHALLSVVDDLSQGLSEALTELVSGGREAEAGQILENLSRLFSEAEELPSPEEGVGKGEENHANIGDNSVIESKTLPEGAKTASEPLLQELPASDAKMQAGKIVFSDMDPEKAEEMSGELEG